MKTIEINYIQREELHKFIIERLTYMTNYITIETYEYINKCNKITGDNILNIPEMNDCVDIPFHDSLYFLWAIMSETLDFKELFNGSVLYTDTEKINEYNKRFIKILGLNPKYTEDSFNIVVEYLNNDKEDI